MTRREIYNCPKLSEKLENLYVTKLVLKQKTSNRKGHTSLLVFCFWDFKLVSIESALNSTLGNLTYFLNNVGVLLRGAAKLLIEVFQKCHLPPVARFGQAFCLSNRPGLMAQA